jgi:2-oxoglutarate ferredoxin oxidoreductase subunit gamma
VRDKAQPAEIRIAGFVEQGVILFAKTLAKAIVANERRHASMTHDIDTGAGGCCSAQLLVADEPLVYHRVSKPDFLVAMSQGAYARFSPAVKPDGLVLVEEDLVYISGMPEHTRVYRIPALRMAEALGNRILLNVVMLAAFGAVSGIAKRESLRNAVETSFPPAFRELSLEAYDAGYERGRQQLLSGPLRIPVCEPAQSVSARIPTRLPAGRPRYFERPGGH